MNAFPPLEPCPCCCGEAAFGTIKYSAQHAVEQGWSQTIFHRVNCIRCGVSTDTMVGHISEAAAAEAWNLRSGCLPVPKGWKLAPDEPTREMRLAVWRDQYLFYNGTPEQAETLALERVNDDEQRRSDIRSYRAMLSAAPTAHIVRAGETSLQKVQGSPAVTAPVSGDLVAWRALAAPIIRRAIFDAPTDGSFRERLENREFIVRRALDELQALHPSPTLKEGAEAMRMRKILDQAGAFNPALSKAEIDNLTRWLISGGMVAFQVDNQGTIAVDVLEDTRALPLPKHGEAGE